MGHLQPYREKFLKPRWVTQLLRQPGTPHEVAWAFALGTFISLLPTPGLNTVLVMGLAARWKQIHRPAIFTSLGVWNVFVASPLYAAGIKAGQWMLQAASIPIDNGQWGHSSWLVAGSLLTGNVAVALATAVLCYTAVKAFAARYKHVFSQTNTANKLN